MKQKILVVIFCMLSYSAFSQSYSKQERVFWLSQIWKDVSDYYYDPDKLVRINWDSLFVSYIPQVERSTDDDDFYRTLQRFMVHVRDGTRKSYASAYWTGWLGKEGYIASRSK